MSQFLTRYEVCIFNEPTVCVCVCVCVCVQETVLQLSRMGVGTGFGDIVDSGVVKEVRAGEDSESSEDYDSDVDGG